MKAAPTCHRCRAPLARGNQWAIVLPSAALPLAVVTICSACLDKLASWLGVTK